MKYEIKYSNKFKKSLKKCYKRGLDVEKLRIAISTLEMTGTLPPEYRPHILVGKYSGTWECHIEPDWLLLWEQYDTQLVLLLVDTGSHADLFG